MKSIIKLFLFYKYSSSYNFMAGESIVCLNIPTLFNYIFRTNINSEALFELMMAARVGADFGIIDLFDKDDIAKKNALYIINQIIPSRYMYIHSVMECYYARKHLAHLLLIIMDNHTPENLIKFADAVDDFNIKLDGVRSKIS